MKSFQESASFEHTFWLQIMGDHARFIRDSLFPSEAAELHIAKSFVNTYDTYLDQARQTIEPAEWTHLTRQTEHATREFREYKLSIMERHIQGKIGIHLSPTFINHMVNELDEYLLIIGYLKEKKSPPFFMNSIIILFGCWMPPVMQVRYMMNSTAWKNVFGTKANPSSNTLKTFI